MGKWALAIWTVNRVLNLFALAGTAWGIGMLLFLVISSADSDYIIIFIIGLALMTFCFAVQVGAALALRRPRRIGFLLQAFAGGLGIQLTFGGRLGVGLSILIFGIALVGAIAPPASATASRE